jgi:transcriptional regulator with XRE-family HTH domain
MPEIKAASTTVSGTWSAVTSSTAGNPRCTETDTDGDVVAKGKYADWITEDGLLLLGGWARDGLTDEQIAHNIGISTGTLYAWKNDHPEISEAIKKGKAPVDLEVENALLKKALGFTVTVKKPIKLKTKKQLKDEGTIEEERIEYADEEIYIPPETAAQIFWLKNRRPDKWRDKPAPVETEQTEDDGFLAALSGSAAEDWADEG